MVDDSDFVLAVQTRSRNLTQITALIGQQIYRKGDLPTTPIPPFVVVSEASDVPGLETSSSNYALGRVQCSCFASTDQAAGQIAKTLGKYLPCHDVILPIGEESLRVMYLKDAGTVSYDENVETHVYMHSRDFKIFYTY